MNFVVLAERSGSLQPERIRRALDTVQQEHALLQTSIQWSDEQGLRFEPAPGVGIELQCDQSSADQWQSLIEQELAHPFATGSAPLIRCLYIELTANATPQCPADACVLALTFHHSVADGRSGVDILRRLLGLMAQDTAPLPNTSATHLPPMAEWMPARYHWAQQPETAKQLRHTLVADYRRHGLLPAIPWLATQAEERLPKIKRLQMDADTTTRLIERARANGTTVHGALCAAQLLAQFRLQPTDEPTAFFLSCPVNLRPHLDGTPATTPTGFFTSLISGSFLTGPHTEVWALAREITAQTRRQIERGEGHLLYHLYGLDGTPVRPAFMETFRKKALASLPNTMVSNIGQVAPVEEDPAVQAISFALCPMPYQTLFTAASSYQGQLVLNLGYDAARITPATAQALVSAVQEVLLTLGDTTAGL